MKATGDASGQSPARLIATGIGVGTVAGDLPDTIKGAHSKAQLLKDQGQLAEAEPLYRQVLDDMMRLFGE